MIQETHTDFSDLQIKLNLAREKLQQAWDIQGVTNPAVLQAGWEFDTLLNEYLRLRGLHAEPRVKY